jgi:MoaA/NifB/PqqE/SkfB family radical SAM enzyme
MSHLDTLCVEVTSRCPLQCVHCSACASPHRSDTMDLSVLEAILDGDALLEEIYLSGGEPFEHPQLEPLVLAARAKARRVILYSSGTSLTSTGPQPLPVRTLEKLATLGVARIDLSIYSAQPQRHEATTLTPGSFSLTLESARRIRAAGIDLGVHVVPFGLTRRCVEDLVELALELDARRLHVLALARQGRALKVSESSMAFDCSKALAQLYRRPPAGLEIIFSSSLRKALDITEVSVRDAWRSAFVDVQGFVYPGEGHRLPITRHPTQLGLGRPPSISVVRT